MWVMYKIDCKECEGDYIGKTGRAFGTRFKEHSNISGTSKGTFPGHVFNHNHREGTWRSARATLSIKKTTTNYLSFWTFCLVTHATLRHVTVINF